MSLMLLYEIVDVLSKKKIKYAIVGGYAMAIHGLVRATMDVDLVLNLKLKDFEQVETALEEIGLKSRLPVRAKEIFAMRREYIMNRNLIAWSFVDYQDPTRQADILITTDLKGLEVEQKSIGGHRVSVVSLKDLLKMKQSSGREQDLIDVQKIREKLKNAKAKS